MMLVPLEKQVTSLDLSNRLEVALGKQDTLYGWFYPQDPDQPPVLCERTQDAYAAGHFVVPAYTTDELLEWLRPYSWQMTLSEDGYYIVDVLYMDHLERCGGSTPAEALGELALKVKEGR